MNTKVKSFKQTVFLSE